jgi:predicted Zn-dependent protease
VGSGEHADPLTLAADALGRGDRPAAADHLAAYVRRHPDQLMFRAQLAELLLSLDRPAEAKAEFERFVADAQSAAGPPGKHLVHCHTRLMEIGQRADDRFAERFHRGVGLLRLAADLGSDESAEEVLCQALKALTEAKDLRPSDPRVHLYLADAYALTGNRRAAEVARATARDRAAPGSLTAEEAARLSVR